MSNIWCEKHWVPYSTGELNGLLASLLLQQETLNSEVFMRRCGWNPETGAQAETERLNQETEKIKTEFGGLCCFLGDVVIERILATVKSRHTLRGN